MNRPHIEQASAGHKLAVLALASILSCAPAIALSLALWSAKWGWFIAILLVGVVALGWLQSWITHWCFHLFFRGVED